MGERERRQRKLKRGGERRKREKERSVREKTRSPEEGVCVLERENGLYLEVWAVSVFRTAMLVFVDVVENCFCSGSVI